MINLREDRTITYIMAYVVDITLLLPEPFESIPPNLFDHINRDIALSVGRIWVEAKLERPQSQSVEKGREASSAYWSHALGVPAYWYLHHYIMRLLGSMLGLRSQDCRHHPRFCLLCVVRNERTLLDKRVW